MSRTRPRSMWSRRARSRRRASSTASCCSRSEEHTSELQSLRHLVCRLLLEKKKHRSTKKATPQSRCEKKLGTRKVRRIRAPCRTLALTYNQDDPRIGSKERKHSG